MSTKKSYVNVTQVNVFVFYTWYMKKVFKYVKVAYVNFTNRSTFI